MSLSSSPKDSTKASKWWWRPCKIGWIGLRFFWGTIVLGLALNISVSLAFFNRGVSLHSLYFWPVVSFFQDNLFLIGFIFFVLIGLTVVIWFGSRPEGSVPREPISLKVPAMRDRTNLLQQLGLIYEKRLTISLQGVKSIEVSLEEWANISISSQLDPLHLDDPKQHAIPMHSSIIEVYEKAGESLLILGAPGAGKTTLLLKLALELLNRAKQDPDQPIPLLIDLSLWDSKKKNPSFLFWLLDRLYTDYRLSHDVSTSWIKENKFSLLLDGLDEVPGSSRPKCIEYINDFRQTHFASLVVCSRTPEDPKQLRLPLEVVVQPLTLKQINDFLKSIGKPAAAVRAALRINPVLRDIVTTPLMLRTLILAYYGKNVKDLPQLGTEEEQRRQIFEHYVEQMLEQQNKIWNYSSSNTKHWLIWLAKQMQKNYLAEFNLAQLQSDWLPTRNVKRLYVWILGIFLGFLVGALLGLAVGITLGLIVGLSFGLVVGLSLGMFFVWWSYPGIAPKVNLYWSINNIWHFRGIVLYGVLLGILCIGLYSIVAIGLAFGLILELYIGVYCVMLFGLSWSDIDSDMHKKPDQEITNSRVNALRMGLIFGLLSEIFLGLLSGMEGKLLSGVIFGLIIGLFTGLYYGGAFFLNHYLIRFLLYKSEVMPLNYVRFLNEAASRYLLLSTANGYRFSHQLFQEYFASLG